MTERWQGLESGQRPYKDAALFYSKYRYRPSAAFVRLLAAHLGWSSDERLLDLGAGPAPVSTLLSPFVGEVTVMEPDEAMLNEGRKHAEHEGFDNLSFVLGGSDDLPRLKTTLGTFAAVVISQAFHWMHDQDTVLRSLDEMLDRKQGAVVLIGYVNQPDYNRASAGLDRAPWNMVEEILWRHLEGVPQGPNPGGRHDPFPDILQRSTFPRLELLSYEYEVTVRPSIDTAIGTLYTLSNTLNRLGPRREAFEAEVHEKLAHADTTPYEVRLTDSALIGRRAR